MAKKKEIKEAQEILDAQELQEIKDVQDAQDTQDVEEIKNDEMQAQANQADEPQAPVEEVKEDAQAAQEAQEEEMSGAGLYAKHAAAVNDAKQFYQCKLPSMSYYSKRALCDAVDNMKRMCTRSNGNESFNMCVEMLEMAIAYLYNRKVNG